MAHTLLLADDSVTIQRVIELTFADEDVQVVAVSDGDEAIARIEASPPDIILADVGMPGKNGYEVAKHVKQSPRLAHIPVVLLTGAFEPVDQARAAEAGCEGVLAKPFEPQLVIGRVRELLSRVVPPPPSYESVAAKAPWPAPSGAAAPASHKGADPFGGAQEDEIFGGTPAATPGPRSGDLNNYFDRLDQAFANLTSSPAPAAQPPSADTDWFQAVKVPEGQAPAADQWDIAAPSFELPDLPISYTPEPVPHAPAAPPTQSGASAAPAHAQPQAPAAAQAEASPRQIPGPPATESSSAARRAVTPLPPVSSAAAVQARASSIAPVAHAPMPPLAEAFAALLAAEQGTTGPLPTAHWPASAPAAAITEDQLEDVVKRVLDRLSDRVVHDAVRNVVSPIAERLVREEIDRIKASIR